MSDSIKRMPPYAKQLARSPLNRLLFIICGADAWKLANTIRNNLPFLLLPPDGEPSEYEWPVNGRDCLVYPVGHISKNTIRTLSGNLVIAGAATVNVSAS